MAAIVLMVYTVVILVVTTNNLFKSVSKVFSNKQVDFHQSRHSLDDLLEHAAFELQLSSIFHDQMPIHIKSFLYQEFVLAAIKVILINNEIIDS